MKQWLKEPTYLKVLVGRRAKVLAVSPLPFVLDLLADGPSRLKAIRASEPVAPVDRMLSSGALRQDDRHSPERIAMADSARPTPTDLAVGAWEWSLWHPLRANAKEGLASRILQFVAVRGD